MFYIKCISAKKKGAEVIYEFECSDETLSENWVDALNGHLNKEGVDVLEDITFDLGEPVLKQLFLDHATRLKKERARQNRQEKNLRSLTLTNIETQSGNINNKRPNNYRLFQHKTIKLF